MLLQNPYPQWLHRNKISVTSPTSIDNYQIEVVIPWKPGMRAAFDDIRFSSVSGDKLSYWIEPSTVFSTATVWIKCPANTSSFYLFYGNGNCLSESSAKNTFIIGDDFTRAGLDSQWTWDHYTTNTYSIANGALTIVDKQNTHGHIQATGTPTQFIAEVKLKYVTAVVEASWAPGLLISFGALNNVVAVLRNNAGAFFATSTSQAGNNSLNAAQTGSWAFSTYYYLRIIITSLTVSVYYSADGVSWTQILSYDKPSIWSPGATTKVAIGQGYEATGYTNPDMNNSYATPGANVTSVYDWVRVRQYAATEPTATIGEYQNNQSITKYVICSAVSSDYTTLPLSSTVIGSGSVTAVIINTQPLIPSFLTSSVTGGGSQIASITEFERIASSIVSGGSQIASITEFERIATSIVSGGSQRANITELKGITSRIVSGGGSQTVSALILEMMHSSIAGIGYSSANQVTTIYLSSSLDGGGIQSAALSYDGRDFKYPLTYTVYQKSRTATVYKKSRTVTFV